MYNKVQKVYEHFHKGYKARSVCKKWLNNLCLKHFETKNNLFYVQNVGMTRINIEKHLFYDTFLDNTANIEKDCPAFSQLMSDM